MVRRNVWLLSVTLVVVVGSFVLTLMSGNRPILGLDLQGGISVVLQPVGKYNTESLDVAKNIIDRRVNALGVGEPEISRQGSQIIVDLPGVKNRDKAKRIVGQTAELRFRPVLAASPAVNTTTTKPGTKTSTTGTSTTTGATTAAPTTAASTTAASPDAATSSTVSGGGGKARHLGSTTTAATTTAGATTTAASTTAATTTAGPTTTDGATTSAAGATTTAAGGTSTTAANPTPKLTPRAKDKADQIVTLPDRDGNVYVLGPVPANLTGNQISSAQSALDPNTNEWVVNVSLKSAGAAAFDKLASESFSKPSPQNSVAIVLDSVVQSAPRFNQAGGFNGRVQISGSFDQSSAGDLAAVLKYGALPVSLKQLTSEAVSPTLGKDQLHAGIVAGIIGLALVALYMLVYYRLLGVVVFVGIVISAMALYTLIVFLGQAISLTLTLAGVTGIIVSVGITVDSYVVYYEKLKDEVRTGKTVRSSLDRAFVKSFRTIVAADLVSLLGAAVLYFLAIGSVRGFALFLGISTVLDLIISYTFMHPLVSLLGRRHRFVNGWFGIARGLDVHEEPALQGAQA